MGKKLHGYVCDNDLCRKFIDSEQLVGSDWLTRAAAVFHISDPHPLIVRGRMYFCSEDCEAREHSERSEESPARLSPKGRKRKPGGEE
jgi:hypothetical protein